jgi:hypothetical protein
VTTLTNAAIASRRLHNQFIAAPAATTPAEMVRRLAAVQAQDYLAAKWSLGLRLQGATDAVIEQAYNAGEILRTHLLRPTWHFVTPQDIRWLLALTGPRVAAGNTPVDHRLGLDDALIRRSNDTLASVLAGGRALTRDELRAALAAAGIEAPGTQRLAHLIMRAELDGVICSGPRRGKQFTYALLEERVPPVAPLSRDEALAELARRFFVSRGPATVQDMAKWSGLTVADAKQGLAAVAGPLEQASVGGQTYWFPDTPPAARTDTPTAYLLSVYDEYISGYKDRRAIVSERNAARLVGQGNALQFIVVVDGQVVGTWKRTFSKDSVQIKLVLFDELSADEMQVIAAAAQRFGDFYALPAILV